MQLQEAKKSVAAPSIINARQSCLWLAQEYHTNDMTVLEAAKTLSPHQFFRLFVTAHGMKPEGIWQTHTYVRFIDELTQLEHFFLIPAQKKQTNHAPWIRFNNGYLYIDDIATMIYPQSIPHTTPFWYFHYDPNKENNPFYSMTLNFSPSCIEKCVLCAGAKTGRVNNGMDSTLAAVNMIKSIVEKHPETVNQLDSVAVVTGCFANFNALRTHLSDVKYAVNQFCQPKQFRVLEHNIETPEQFEIIVGELGYDIFITLECFDQDIRNIALNGKVGRKGRDSQSFLTMIKTYADYLESRPTADLRLIRVTYLVGLDSLNVMEHFFQCLAEINTNLKQTKIIPWLSIFTSYNKAMTLIQHPDFGLQFILNAMALAEKYFGRSLLAVESGGTADGYARGLY